MCMRRLLFQSRCPKQYHILELLRRLDYGVHHHQPLSQLQPCIQELEQLLHKEAHLLLDMKSMLLHKVYHAQQYIQQRIREEEIDYCNLYSI